MDYQIITANKIVLLWPLSPELLHRELVVVAAIEVVLAVVTLFPGINAHLIFVTAIVVWALYWALIGHPSYRSTDTDTITLTDIIDFWTLLS